MLLVVLVRLSFFQAELNFLSIDFSCRFNPAGIFFSPPVFLFLTSLLAVHLSIVKSIELMQSVKHGLSNYNNKLSILVFIFQDFQDADLLIVMGTALKVQPFASLIDRCVTTQYLQLQLVDILTVFLCGEEFVIPDKIIFS